MIKYLKGVVLVLALLLLAVVFGFQFQVNVFAQNPIYDWLLQFGSANTTFTNDAVTNTDGSFYVVGSVNGVLPGQGSSGLTDAFIKKVDYLGNTMWTHQFGTSDSDQAWGVVGDNQGNIYVGGNTRGVFSGQTQTSSQDAFVRKYDGNGDVLWTKQFGTTLGDTVSGITLDILGNIYVVGYTATNLKDAFVIKLDSRGNQMWVRVFGTSSGYDESMGISSDNLGNIYVVGKTENLAGPTPGAFVRKYDTSGNVVWTQQFGTPAEDQIFKIYTDNLNGNIYTAGYTRGSFPTFTAQGSGDVFVRKFDINGNYLWTKQFGTSQEDLATGIALDNEKNVFLAGITTGAFPGYTRSGETDSFVAHLIQNLSPTANAGSDITRNEGQAITFDGSGSTDPDGQSDIVNPFVTSGVDAIINESQFYIGSGSFTDAGADTWTATVNYGDGSGSQPLTLSGHTFNLNHQYLNNGSYTITVTVYDDDGFGMDTTTITVNNVAPIINSISSIPPVLPNVLINASANFSDAGILDTHYASWNWGDGNVTQGVITESGGAGNVIGSHTYIASGVYTVTLTVTDNANQTSSTTTTVTVNNIAPVINSISPISPVLPNVLINASASFSDVEILDTHYASWDWGDGVVTQGVVTETNGSGSVVGSHTYTSSGTYTVTLTVSDEVDIVSSTVSVTVLTPAQATQNLIDLVQTFNLQQGIENSLDVKLDNAISALTDLNQNNNQAAVNSLQAFINAAEAQRGNHITNDQADQLIFQARQILNNL